MAPSRAAGGGAWCLVPGIAGVLKRVFLLGVWHLCSPPPPWRGLLFPGSFRPAVVPPQAGLAGGRSHHSSGSLDAQPSDTPLCRFCGVSPRIGTHQLGARGLPTSHLEDAGLQMSSISFLLPWRVRELTLGDPHLSKKSPESCSLLKI